MRPIYYDSSFRKQHSQVQDRRQNNSNSPIVESIDDIEEYESESDSHVSRYSHSLHEFDVRRKSPKLEVVPVHHSFYSSSQLKVARTRGTGPYVISPSNSIIKKVSWIPSKTVRMKDAATQKSLPLPKRIWTTINTKPNMILLITLVSLLVMSLCAIAVLAVLYTTSGKEKSFTSVAYMSSACAANCMMSISPAYSATIASWLFDGSLSDSNNVYSAFYTNPPTVPYVTGNIGSSVSFDGTNYVYSNAHFMNLTYQSWTIEAWIMISSVSGERGIFGQCQSSSIVDACLTISMKSARLHFGFNNDDLDGTTVLSISSTTWHHVAFVYDYTVMQKSIYLDGVLEATSGSSGIAVSPYKGTAGQVTIGGANGTQSFLGLIDQVQVFSGAKTACQILNDAVLTAYYKFDIDGSYLDSSANAFQGIANLLITLPGRLNYAYSFQYEYSYFQSMAFTAYSPAEPFSVALWVYPYSVSSGTLIHLSTQIDGSSIYSACFDLLGFSSSGQLVGQVYDSYATCCPPPYSSICPCQGTANVGGPTMLVNTWTHIVLTYSSSNGLALFTNGTLQGVASPFSSFPIASPDYKVRPYMTVGNPKTSGSTPSCLIGSPALSPAVYRGLVDDLRIYSRELTKSEICSLFHLQ